MAKWRYARNGAIIGIVIVLADLLLEWRGRLYYPWVNAETIVFNIAQMTGVIGIPALIGLVLGAIRDRKVSEVLPAQPVQKQMAEIAPGSSSQGPAEPHLSMASRLGQVLSWAANIIALAILALFLVIAANEQSGAGIIVIVGVVVAVVIWLVGRGVRYVLAGS